MSSVRTLARAERIVVRIADVVASENPGAVLVTHSLGSCLGVSVYDPQLRAGGLLHAMLPDSQLDPVKAMAHPGMFMDSGLDWLFRSLAALGSRPERWQIAAAGGAQILDPEGHFSIGRKNREALQQILYERKLCLAASDLGGFVNRTMSLSLATGEVYLRVSGETPERRCLKLR